MCADPLGRLASRCDVEYSKFKLRNNEKLDFYYDAMDTTKTDGIIQGESYKGWRSFSNPPLILIGQTKIPLLLVYGDLDEGCPNCYIFSFLPTYYPLINVKTYKNYGHNFNDLTSTVRNDKNWTQVMQDVISWIEMKKN